MQSSNGQVQQIGNVLNSQDIPTGILPANTVFVGTGTSYENPFKMGIHGTRDECIERYNHMIASMPEFLESLDALQGKDLITLDAPERSHANTLAYLASINYRQRLAWAEDIKGIYGETAALAA